MTLLFYLFGMLAAFFWLQPGVRTAICCAVLMLVGAAGLHMLPPDCCLGLAELNLRFILPLVVLLVGRFAGKCEWQRVVQGIGICGLLGIVPGSFLSGDAPVLLRFVDCGAGDIILLWLLVCVCARLRGAAVMQGLFLAAAIVVSGSAGVFLVINFVLFINSVLFEVFLSTILAYTFGCDVIFAICFILAMRCWYNQPLKRALGFALIPIAFGIVGRHLLFTALLWS